MILRSIIWFALFSSALLHARRQNLVRMLLWCVMAVFILNRALPSFRAVAPVLAALLSDAPLTVPSPDSLVPPSGNWANVPPDIARWRPQIEEAGAKCGVEPLLIAAIMTQESGGNPNLCSNAGACGLMQLMPGTAKQVNVLDRFNPTESIRGGACYYALMAKRYGQQDVALAAYNAGPGNVDKHGGIPSLVETQLYVRNVTAYYKRYTSNTVAKALGSSYKFVSNPFKNFIITSRYKSVNFSRPDHKGLDLVAKNDTTIYAVDSGVVEHVGPVYCANSCLGPYAIVIAHGTWRSVYGHGYANVNKGDKVSAGQAIGRQGALGNVTGPHLHLEVRVGGRLELYSEGVANILGSEIKNPEDYLREE